MNNILKMIYMELIGELGAIPLFGWYKALPPAEEPCYVVTLVHPGKDSMVTPPKVPRISDAALSDRVLRCSEASKLRSNLS